MKELEFDSSKLNSPDPSPMPPMPSQGFRPVLVVCFPRVTWEQMQVIEKSLASKNLEQSGWKLIAIEGFDKMDVRAFGVPESQLEEFETLKELIEKSFTK